MSDVDIQMIRQIKDNMIGSFAAFKKQAVFSKQAFTPAAPPAGPQMAPPADPNAMPPGGAPPMDQGMMPPGGAPPMDPNAMPPGGAPPAPDGGQGVPPELQQTLSDLAGGVEGMSNTMKEQQSAIDQLAQRQLENEKIIQELRQALKGPQPFAGPEQAAPAAEAPAGA